MRKNDRPLCMAEMTCDLQRAIDGLHALASDLTSYYWRRPVDGPRDSRRFEISHWIRQVSDRSVALEQIVMHKGSRHMRLHEVSAAEAEVLETAMTMLEQWVDEDDPFDRVLEIVAA